jgi:hypothetical protein
MGKLLNPLDAHGVWPLLLTVSGYVAMERSSQWVESRDLLKAIYVADLEHVSFFWDDWQGFESLVAGFPGGYVNRLFYLLTIHLMGRDASPEGSGFAAVLGQPTQELLGILDDARQLAIKNRGVNGTPSSRELLFCVCSADPELSEALQKSGLQLAKLAACVHP